MNNRISRDEYFSKRAVLFAEYKFRLSEVTWQAKKYSYEWTIVKNNYKNNYDKKYWKTISKLSESKLNTLANRIDQMIIDVNEWDHSDDVKEKFNTMLLALREIVLDNMDNYEDPLNIDSLFDDL